MLTNTYAKMISKVGLAVEALYNSRSKVILTSGLVKSGFLERDSKRSFLEPVLRREEERGGGEARMAYEGEEATIISAYIHGSADDDEGEE